MALLDEANTSRYGHPEITKVDIGVRKNHAILISGHDLTDLEQLLKQTEGTGIDVYTHGEMLPPHYYPEIRKYKTPCGQLRQRMVETDRGVCFISRADSVYNQLHSSA